MTLDSLFELAAKKLGSRDAVVAELGVSRQRLQDARRGGPPLRPERLVKLGLIAGVEPLDALRAGGRDELATLLAAADDVRTTDATADQRALLHGFSRLTERMQALVLHLMRELAAKEDAAAPPARKKPDPAAASSRRTRRVKR